MGGYPDDDQLFSKPKAFTMDDESTKILTDWPAGLILYRAD